VYSLIVVPITSDAGRNLGGENALKTISAATGGLWFRQHANQDLDAAFEQILRDLRVQYMLGFYPRGIPLGTSRFHRIEIQVDRPGVRVLARSGYYVPKEGAVPARTTTRSNQ
jgi:Ca-activated chloride channel family protein